jgi:predicted amidohydrolase YtcJ
MQQSTAFFNGNILTINDNDDIAEAMLITGNRIDAVGTNDEIRALTHRAVHEVDLGGKTVMPGIIDAHVHIELTTNQQMNGVNVQQPFGPNCDTLEKVFAEIRKKVETTPPGTWITAMASNMFPMKVAEGRLPTRQDLDAISTVHPIQFTSEVHISVLNTLAIQARGYDLERRLFGQSSMARDENGEPTGVYTELWSDPRHSLTPWGYETCYNALKTGVVPRYTKYGVTSADELIYSHDGIKAWQQLHREGDLPLRLRLFFTHPQLIDLDKFLEARLEKDFGDDWLSIGGIKLFADGFGLNAYMAPYNDTKYDAEELEELVWKAHSNGLQVWTHNVTDPAFGMTLNAYKKAQERLFIPDARMRIEHSGDRISLMGLPEDIIKTFKDNGILLMATPQFSYNFLNHETDYATYIHKYGFKMFYNSDTTGSQPEAANPWFSIWELVTRHHYDGSVHKPQECLTVSEALRSATAWAAYSAFEEKKKGSLEPGKLADFLILDRDPLRIDPEDLLNVECDLVVIDGKEKYAQNNCSGILN